MKILIVFKMGSFGLTIDADILRKSLQDDGHTVALRDIGDRKLSDRLFGKKEADIVFHVERVNTAWVNAAPFHVLVPNQERFPRRQIGLLKKIDLVAAKSRHAEAVFSATTSKTRYLGFTSRDRFMPNVQKNWSAFLHVAGLSTLKGTEDILALWGNHPEWPELVLVQKASHIPRRLPKNVRAFSGHIDNTALMQMQNEYGLHLCPSRSEGWGHYIHEAMSCGAVVLTTDGPPMNEFIDKDTGVLVPYIDAQPRHLGTNFYVDPKALEVAIEVLITMPESQKQNMGEQARARFLERDKDFRQRSLELFEFFGRV
jgi:glycosyltransferase involved in cell wall biosynthesis